MPGYSGTPLVKKLGLKDGIAALLVDVPETVPDISRFRGFASLETGLKTGPRNRDYVHIFATAQGLLTEALPIIVERLKADGMAWISWPKKASKMPTDITEDRLRDIFLPHQLVDVKVCAIDDTWSGLKFMWRISHRTHVI